MTAHRYRRRSRGAPMDRRDRVMSDMMRFGKAFQREREWAEGRLQLGGDHMTYAEAPDGTLTLTFDDKGTGRVCGSCSLCCKLLPLPVLDKPANQRCEHQRHSKGCAIYATRPYACRTWSCRWVSDRTATEGMPRPDRAHYVIDIVPDHIDLMADESTGETRRVNVVTVWCDPAYRDAWRAPELRAFMLRMAEQWQLATTVRWNSSDALVVFPPPFDKAGQWHEVRGVGVRRDEDQDNDARSMAKRMTVNGVQQQ